MIKMINFASLTNFDFVIFVIIAISTIIAFFKGFIKSFLYFFGWVVSAMIVIDSYPQVSTYLQSHIKSQFLVSVSSTFGFFIVILIIISIINSKVITFTSNIRGGAIDCSMGFAFGLIRGCIISCALFWSLVIVLNAWDDREDPKWLSEAQSYQLLNYGANYLVSVIAQDTNRNELLKVIDKKNKFKISNPPVLLDDEMIKKPSEKIMDYLPSKEKDDGQEHITNLEQETEKNPNTSEEFESWFKKNDEDIFED